MSNELKEVLKTKGKKKNELTNKIKEMRSKAFKSELRGGGKKRKKTKRRYISLKRKKMLSKKNTNN